MNQKEMTPSENVSAKSYDSPPWWYDIRGFFILTFAYNDTLWRQVHFFSKNVSDNHLEAAVGTGSLLAIVMKYLKWIKGRKPKNVIAIDYADDMLKGAQKKLKNLNIKVNMGDLTNIGFNTEQFDSINLANSFHTIKDIQLALAEIYRVLKINGLFCGNVLLPPKKGPFGWLSSRVNSWGKKKGILYRPYKKDEVIMLLANQGFKVIYDFEVGNAYYFRAQK